MSRRAKLRVTLLAGAIALGGAMASILVALPIALLIGFETTTVTSFATLFVASYVGYALVGIGYLQVSGRGWTYLDLRVPDRGDLRYVGGGTIGMFVLVAVVGYLVTVFDIPTTPHYLFEPGLDPQLLVALVPLVLFVNAPVEEFLFRNLVQKLLYDQFTRWGAVLVSSAMFAIVHFPAYYHPNPWAVLTSLLVVFLGSIVFGGVYARTDNLLVPIAVHGLFNAIQIALFYLVVTGYRTTVSMTVVPA